MLRMFWAHHKDRGKPGSIPSNGRTSRIRAGPVAADPLKRGPFVHRFGAVCAHSARVSTRFDPVWPHLRRGKKSQKMPISAPPPSAPITSPYRHVARPKIPSARPLH